MSRVRVLLEGSRSFTLIGGGTLEPSLSVGLRHDGGDAETDSGVEAGAGLAWSALALWLTSDLRFYGLAAHESGGRDEWRASGSLHMAPGPSGRGPVAVAVAVLGRTGVEHSVVPGALAGDGSGARPGAGLDTELGCGLALPDGLTGTTYAGLGLAEAGARSHRLRWRLTLPRPQSFSLGVEATCSEAENGSGASAGRADDCRRRGGFCRRAAWAARTVLRPVSRRQRLPAWRIPSGPVRQWPRLR